MHSLCIPSDVNYIINKITKIPTNEFTNIVNLTMQCMYENNYKKFNFHSLSSKLSLSSQEMEDVFGTLQILIRWCQQLKSLSDKEIKNDLIEQGFTGEWTNNFLNLIMNTTDKISKSNNYTIQLDKFYWRIDISLYNNTLSRSMPQSIIWNLTLNDGKQYTFEISIKKFHEIRFNVSTLLKELNIVKCNSLIRK